MSNNQVNENISDKNLSNKRNIIKDVMVGVFYGIIIIAIMMVVDNNGGMKNTIVKFGKEVKEIDRLVNQ